MDLAHLSENRRPYLVRTMGASSNNPEPVYIKVPMQKTCRHAVASRRCSRFHRGFVTRARRRDGHIRCLSIRLEVVTISIEVLEQH